MTATATSGSSIGMYHTFLGDNQPDKDLIFGEPRGVRSDEWLLITSKTIAQSYNNYDSINQNIGINGENVSLRPDIPTNNINTIFRPQNWAFLVMPLENAVAFKWWFFTVLVLITSYYFSLRFFTKSILLSIFLSLFLVFAPLPQWTYREFIFLTLGFGMLGIIAMDWLQSLVLRKKKQRNKRLHYAKLFAGTAAVGYLAVAFILVLYPPMQISIALVLILFYLDIVRRRMREYKVNLKDVFKAQRYTIFALILTAVIGGGIYMQQKSEITALLHTKHPGVRHFESGWTGKSPDRTRNLFVGGSVPFLLQKDSALGNTDYFNKTKTGNQSEASNYPWLLPLLVIVATVSFWFEKRKDLPIYTILGSVFVMAWMLIPGMQIPIIDQVQPARWNLAIGLLTFLLLGLLSIIMERGRGLKNRVVGRGLVAIGALYILINTWLFISLKSDFGTLVGKIDVATFTLLAIIPILLIVTFKYYKVALGLLATTSLLVNINVNPLYHGVAAATQNKLVSTIRTIDEKNKGTWLMATGAEAYEAVPTLAGAKSFTSHFSYPQHFWNYLDTNGTQEFVYNRAAHTVVSLTDDPSNIYLKSTNSIGTNLNPCNSRIFQKLSIDYVVTKGEYNGKSAECLIKLQNVDTTQFIIYTLKKNQH